MSAIRVTAMLCVTTLVIITGALMYANKQDRYVILPQNNAMFIFDRQNASVNYCTSDQCRLVMPFGSVTMPGMGGMGGMMPNGMGMPGGGMPAGFQPFAAPGGDPSMMIPTGMAGASGQNNPMMMWAYMQAASSIASQKGSFSSLQNQPSWMNIMAMTQPTTTAKGKSVSAQSPIVPTAMHKPMKSKKHASHEESSDDVEATPDEGVGENQEGADEGSSDESGGGDEGGGKEEESDGEEA